MYPLNAAPVRMRALAAAERARSSEAASQFDADDVTAALHYSLCYGRLRRNESCVIKLFYGNCPVGRKARDGGDSVVSDGSQKVTSSHNFPQDLQQGAET